MRGLTEHGGAVRAEPGGFIEVRLMGDEKDLEPLIAILREQAAVFRVRGPRANREDPGVRFYITMQLRERP